MSPRPLRLFGLLLMGGWLAASTFAKGAEKQKEPIEQMTEAIAAGNLAAVQKLLAAGFDPNTRVPGEQIHVTALFHAVEQNQPTITEALLKAGADPKIEDDNHDPVMAFAADPDHLEHAKLLIAHGVSINAKNSNGDTVLTRCLGYARREEVKAMLQLGADPESKNAKGETALMIAAESRNREAVAALLEAGAKVDERNDDGLTALWLAATSDSSGAKEDAPGTIRTLLKAGASIKGVDAEGRGILMAATDAYNCKPATIEALLEGKPDLKLRGPGGRSVLSYVVWEKDLWGLTDRLIEAGADPKAIDQENTDLLMEAAGQNSPELVAKFLKLGLSPKAKDKKGEGAFYHAAWAARSPLGDHNRFFRGAEDAQGFDKQIVEVFRLLHEAGGDPRAANLEGSTPLHEAAGAAGPAAVKWLLPHYPNPDIMDEGGRTPLHRAASRGDVEVLDLLLPKFRDVDAKDIEGWTPLIYAAVAREQAAVERLLQAGADINAKDEKGKSAFDEAIEEKDMAFARFLTEKGAKAGEAKIPAAQLLEAAREFHDKPMAMEDYAFSVGFHASLADEVNAKDDEGMTALMWVAASNNPAALEALLKRKPDLNALSADGRSALMWAAAAEAKETMKLLEAAGADKDLRDPAGRTAADWLARVKDTGISQEVVGVAPGTPFPALSTMVDSRRKALAEYLERGEWKAGDRIDNSAPLHIAAALGDTAALTALLDKGAAVNQSLDGGVTALMEAALYGQVAAMELLLKRGADASLRDSAEQRAMDRALYMGHAGAARLLLRQEKSLRADETRLLQGLAASGDKTLLEDFLKAGASVPENPAKADDCCPGRGASDPADPLRTAAATKDPTMLRVLLRYPKASGADKPEYLGRALQAAAENDGLVNVKFLVEEAKADPNFLFDSAALGGVTRVEPSAAGSAEQGFSALSLALEQGHEEIVRYLVEHGAKIIGRTRGGLPPLAFAAEQGQGEMLRYFLEKGASTEGVDFDGKTALHHAAEIGDAAAVKLLLEKGAKAGAKDEDGKTPLALAKEAERGEPKEAVRLLEEAGKAAK